MGDAIAQGSQRDEDENGGEKGNCLNEPTHLDLFSGIGGFSLAFEAEGFRTIGFSEIDPFACAVLKKHWPTVPNYGAVQSVPAIRCDVITGGFPCQPYSLAGKRAGSKDDRALWPAMCAVIERCRPAFVLGENVPGIIGMELDNVLSDLERIGYTARTLVIPACAADAHHLRSRVWILAHAGCNAARGESELAGQAAERSQGIAESANHGQNVADTNQPGSQRRNGGIVQECSKEWTSRTRSPRPDSPAIWYPEPELGRVANGIPNRAHRLRTLGNAVVPPLVRIFAKSIKTQLEQ